MGKPRAQASAAGNAASQPVYHWTDMGDFDVFEHTNDIGYHFGTRETAEARARLVRGPVPISTEERIITAHLDVRASLDLPDLGDWSPRSVISALQRAGVLAKDLPDEDLIVDLDFVAGLLTPLGLDCIRYPNTTEGGGDSWIVFDPNFIHITSREHLTPEN